MHSGYVVLLLAYFTLAVILPGYLSSVIKPSKNRHPRSILGRKKSSLSFHTKPPSKIAIKAFETTTLECNVRSHPPAIIYWLKDGKRISNNTYEVEKKIDNYVRSVVGSEDDDGIDTGRSLTASKLAIHCAKPQDSGRYSCVAENIYDEIIAETNVNVKPSNDITEVWDDVEECSSSNINGAKVVLWSDSFLAVEGSTIRLVCRASGIPTPKITWFIEGHKQLLKIHNGNKYRVLNNGDLVIRDLAWETDMGQFKCRAENDIGSDDVSAFVYAMAK